MKIALYRGISWVSYAIRWITRSPYSHAAFVFDEETEAAASRLVKTGFDFKQLACISAGSVVEAWQGGVKNSPSISTLHTDKTTVDLFSFVNPLTGLEEEYLLKLLVEQIGDPYSYLNVIRFVTRTPGREDGSWFCSEMVFQDCRDIGRLLLNNKPAWAVPPDWLQMSTELKFIGFKITNSH